MRIPKICLKQSFSHSKWGQQAILSVIVLSNCVSGNLNFDTPLFSLTVPNFVMLFRLFDKKFNEDSKTLLKTVIFSL